MILDGMTYLFSCKTGKESDYKNDVTEVYVHKGDYFGIYLYSGIRAITNRLKFELEQKYKIDSDKVFP